MSDWQLPWYGGCRCHETRVVISEPPLLTSACHCKSCQRMSASAFSLTLAVPASGFAVIFGVPVSGGLKGTTRHFFCPTCKSWVYTQLEGIDDYVNVRSTLLDRHGWFVPFIETWTQHKLPWARTPAQHRFATQPDPAAFKQLAQVFAKRGARPRPVGSSGFAFW